MLQIFRSNHLRKLIAIVPAIIIVGLTLFVFYSVPRVGPSENVQLPGIPLAAIEDLYPVQVDKTGGLSLDVAVFVKALTQLDHRHSPRAIADLIYFGQANNVSLMLSDNEKKLYADFLNKHPFAEDDVARYMDKHLQQYIDIVTSMGKTFTGTGVEIVLHDMRNPLKAIIAIKNPISGRRVGDPTTNFGLQMIKSYTSVPYGQPSLVAYPLKLKDGRAIKSTTIPVYDEEYGLIATICINIDISHLDPEVFPVETAAFLKAFRATDASTHVDEMIENSRSVK